MSNDSDDLASLNLVGESQAWQFTLRTVRRVARHQTTTLIEGETGTGKELVARAIHYLGPRREFPFIPLNCGALPDTLLESELFGHERGAFTDAREGRGGLIAAAQGGTLFLDEVEAMSPRAQVVLLRFLQDHTFLSVGGRTVKTADVRIVAASNANLDELVELGRFRCDLLFRLRVLYLRLPPLRDRLGDVTLLTRRFLERFSHMYERPPVRASAQALATLEAHRWPGNVRELESVILREFLMYEENGDELTITTPLSGSAPQTMPTDFRSAKAQAVADFERSYLQRLLLCARGNLSLAARLARKDRGALKKLVRKHGISADNFRSEAPLTPRFRLA